MVTAPSTVVTMDSSDAELIQSCRSGLGSSQALAQTLLCKRYLPFVYNVVYRLVGQASIAEDMTQETFMRVIRSLNQFDTQRSFKPWVVTIATNVCKTHLKKQQSAPILLSGSDDDTPQSSPLENMADPSTWPPDDGFMDGVSEAELNAALDELSPTIRQALILRHLHDMSYEDIAVALEANLNSVRTWLKRGRERLLRNLWDASQS